MFPDATTALLEENRRPLSEVTGPYPFLQNQGRRDLERAAAAGACVTSARLVIGDSGDVDSTTIGVIAASTVVR